MIHLKVARHLMTEDFSHEQPMHGAFVFGAGLVPVVVDGIAIGGIAPAVLGQPQVVGIIHEGDLPFGEGEVFHAEKLLGGESKRGRARVNSLRI